MIKQKLHLYLGTNGTLLTPINIVGAQGVIQYHLEAENGKKLTKDNVNFVDAITVPEDEVDEWSEVEAK